MADTVDIVIELPVWAIALTPRRRLALVVLPAVGVGAHRTVAGHRRRAAADVAGRTQSPRSISVTRCLDAIERRGRQPTDRQHAERLTAA